MPEFLSGGILMNIFLSLCGPHFQFGKYSPCLLFIDFLYAGATVFNNSFLLLVTTMVPL